MTKLEEKDKVTELTDKIWAAVEERTAAGTRLVVAVAEVIETFVNDPMLAHSVIRRMAREAAADESRLDDLYLLLARTALARDRKEVRSAAAYFGSSAKRLAIHKWGVLWHEEPDRQQRRK